MINWDRIEELTKFIETIPEGQVGMNKLLVINRGKETVEEARNPTCGTVGCIAGWAFCLFEPKETVLISFSENACGFPTNVSHPRYLPLGARKHLRLNLKEAEHMFLAGWSKYHWNSGKITKEHILTYLKKALKAKDIMVRI